MAYYDDDSEDMVQPTLGLTDAQMLERQNALANVHTIEDWYRMYPQHQSRWAKPSRDKVAETVTRATMMVNGQLRPLPGKVMTSRYNGRCQDCGGFVAEGDTIRYDGKVHHYPSCPEQPEVATQPQPNATYSPAPQSTTSATSATLEGGSAAAASLPDGRITLQFTDGHHRTFRIVTQAADATFAPGKRIVKYLANADNEDERSYIGFGFLLDNGQVAMWSRFKGDTQLAADASVLGNKDKAMALGLAYALASSNCWRCGHTLTVPASIHRGLGPDCAKKGYF